MNNNAKQYHYVFITNIPSFYKINLFNLLSSHLNIKVIFISDQSLIRNKDFTSNEKKFEHEYINSGPFEKRNKIKTIFKVWASLKKLDYQNLIFPGWEIIELMLLVFLLPRRKNGIVIESSILETKTSGLPWFLKVMFLKRMGKAFPAGVLQKDILYKANFEGGIYETHGVGVLSDNFSQKKNEKNKERPELLSYIYVGRLSEEKNVSELITTFNKINNKLYMIGDGPLKDELQKKANSNIIFLGHINNSELDLAYEKADVFVLPSISEPWGLVVEEALKCRLPLIVSDRVGCKDDLVTNLNTGIVFSIDGGGKSLMNAIEEMNLNFDSFKKSVDNLDFSSIDNKKLSVYKDALTNEK